MRDKSGSAGPPYVQLQPIPAAAAPGAIHNAYLVAITRMFSSIPNACLTLATLYLCYLVVPSVVSFLLLDAVWSGSTRDACLTAGTGACWPFVWNKLQFFIYGSYPKEQLWRVDLFFLLAAIGVVWLLWLTAPYRKLAAIYFFIIFPIASFILLLGGHYNFQQFLLGRIVDLSSFGAAAFWLDYLLSAAIALLLIGALCRFLKLQTRTVLASSIIGLAAFGGILASLNIDWGLPHVSTNLWGGIMITIIVALTGIVFSLPCGILLALGRRSTMPVVRFAATLFIEIVRGVPMITVLFMANTMLPLFLSPGNTPDRLLRALVGVGLFASAYMAEVIRGGLQAMPAGQYEGAKSLGLDYPKTMLLVILPQTLRIVIPGIVGIFIGLLKDTTLVFVVGIFDLLKTIDASFADPAWSAPTVRYTGYAAAAMFYFICCYGMSRYALFMERRLETSHRS